jgi:hypothetical protein
MPQDVVNVLEGLFKHGDRPADEGSVERSTTPV